MNELQRNETWFKSRYGKIGASRINDIMSRTKSGYSASRANYMTELILEKLTDGRTESYTSAAMQYGIDTEPEAKEQYQLQTFNIITDCGFILHPDIPESGASPDGLIGDDGLIEVKCFQPTNHLNTLLTGEIETKYIYQMQWQLAVTGRQWNDFCAYNPNFPDGMKIFIKRIEPDRNMIDNITEEVLKFIKEMNEKLNLIKEKYESK